jgi:hypothetical protein
VNTSLLSGGFRCLHCGAFVSADAAFSGVQNRNHCPYCLWSRHLDWAAPGDRLSACKAGMPPIGLTLKQIRKKYGTARSGELMVIHRCAECRRVSANRIAGDDLADALEAVFRSSLDAAERLRNELHAMDIRLLDRSAWAEISRRLFGEVRPFDDRDECGYDRSRQERTRFGRDPR